MPGNAAEPEPPDPSSVAPDAPVITLPGVCEHPPADKTSDPNCKTVVTKADFEQLLSAIAPNIPPQAKRQLATRYAMGLVMATKAEQMGLDKTPRFQEMLKVSRTQALAQELNRTLSEQAGQVSDKDIKDYYDKNAAGYESADLQRIYIPKSKQVVTPKGVKLTAAESKAQQQQGDAAMKAEAEKVRAAAAASASWDKLQAEAFTVAGLKTTPPSTSMPNTRRSVLPASQASVWDLKPGEVSPLMSDSSGYYVYKMGKKGTVPFDQVSDEIKGKLRTQRMQDSMQEIQTSSTPTLNDAYFGAAPAAPNFGIQMKVEDNKPDAKAPKPAPKPNQPEPK
jgi:hypothetical protein